MITPRFDSRTLVVSPGTRGIHLQKWLDENGYSFPIKPHFSDQEFLALYPILKMIVKDILTLESIR